MAASCFALVGGNWNNTLLEGAFYVNLNNTVSNSNTNNGAVQSYLFSELITKSHICSSPLGENKLDASAGQ